MLTGSAPGTNTRGRERRELVWPREKRSWETVLAEEVQGPLLEGPRGEKKFQTRQSLQLNGAA